MLCAQLLSRVQLSQARVLEWMPFPTPGNLPDPIESMFPAAPALAGGFFTTGPSLVAQMVKNLPEIQETQVWFLGQEDLLEKGMATHCSILAWRIPWTEEPGGLQSMGTFFITVPPGKPPELSHTSLYLIPTRTKEWRPPGESQEGKVFRNKDFFKRQHNMRNRKVWSSHSCM